MWIGYMLLWTSDNLGFSFAKSVFDGRLEGLCGSSTYMFAFAVESAVWRLESKRRA